MMTVVGEVVLRWLISIVRTARDVAVLGGSAACSAAVAAAGVLAIVFFAQNALERAESVMMVGGVVLRLMLSSVLTARGDVASSVGCPTACRAVGAAVFASVFAFGEALDDLGAGPLMLVEVVVVRLMLSSVRVACSDVASFGCPAICEAAAVTAAFVNVVLAVVAYVR
jgi:hypothetical protein